MGAERLKCLFPLECLCEGAYWNLLKISLKHRCILMLQLPLPLLCYPIVNWKKQLMYWQCSTSLYCRNEFECGKGASEWKGKIQGNIILYLVVDGLLICSYTQETSWYQNTSWIWIFPGFLEVIFYWINFLTRDLWFVCSNSGGAGVWGHLCLIQSS